VVRLLAALVVAAGLAACNEGMMATDKENGGGRADGAGAAAEVPEDAIAVGDDVYMVPIGEDGTGCPMFRAFSPGKAVIQAIHYRTEDGRFVTDKGEAACGD